MFGRHLHTALLLGVIVAVAGSCIIVVKNRKFAGETEETAIGYGWRTATPKAVAFTSMADKAYWDYKVFQVYIPLARWRTKQLSKDWDSIELGVAEGMVRIDDVRITFATLGDTLVRSIRLQSDSTDRARIQGLHYPQGLFGNKKYLCAMPDTLTIPDDEDTILIQFVVHTSDGEPSHPDTVTNLVFKLWRQEGKKLFLDVGR